MHAAMHSYLRWMPNCIHICNGCRNASEWNCFLLTLSRENALTAVCSWNISAQFYTILYNSTTKHKIYWYKPTERPHSSHFPWKRKLAPISETSTSDHNVSTKQILTLLPILSNGFQENIWISDNVRKGANFDTFDTWFNFETEFGGKIAPIPDCWCHINKCWHFWFLIQFWNEFTLK